MRYKSIKILSISLYLIILLLPLYGCNKQSSSTVDNGYGAAVSNCGGVYDPDNIYACCSNGGNCTWWAWHKANTVWGVHLGKYGNAGQWLTGAQSEGYPTSTTPSVNTISVNTSLFVDGEILGHLGWVEAVNGNEVTVSEMSCCSTCGSGVKTRTRLISYYDGFIYPKSGSVPEKSDIVIDGLTFAPTSGTISSSLSISFRIVNQGNAIAEKSTTRIRINASSNNVTTADTLLKEISVPTILPGASYEVAEALTIPSDSPSGNNYIWVILDVNHTANQNREDNDRSYLIFTVVYDVPVPPPVSPQHQPIL